MCVYSILKQGGSRGEGFERRSRRGLEKRSRIERRRMVGLLIFYDPLFLRDPLPSPHRRHLRRASGGAASYLCLLAAVVCFMVCCVRLHVHVPCFTPRAFLRCVVFMAWARGGYVGSMNNGTALNLWKGENMFLGAGSHLLGGGVRRSFSSPTHPDVQKKSPVTQDDKKPISTNSMKSVTG